MDKMINACIRVWKEDTDYSQLPDQKFYQGYSVCGEVKEVLPDDTPTLMGNYVRLIHYVDVNICHDQRTGSSVTGIIHLVNKTPVGWYSNKQITVEKATYGSDFVSARTCVEKIIH